eukprot:TRINITY_DN39217_c0_g1_i1.p1 TRINITY_DN39217_c0_g1~~TRINITY_DN39217_c0_g1_i1.p1  ORF type:complete len:291 (+),score=55.12 TRINITY_DN39217_c0_g1_i1:152-1024(+)
MAAELYKVRCNKDLPKLVRHNATIALRSIKENSQGLEHPGDHIAWLLDEDLEDNKNSTGEARSEQMADNPTRRDPAWFVLEVPELKDYNNNIELEVQRHCRGVLSIRKGDNQDSLIITCLSSFPKDEVLKDCTDLLFQKRLLARPKSASPARGDPHSSPFISNDSDLSPHMSPPGGQQSSPARKERPAGGAEVYDSLPGTPSTPHRARRDVMGGYKNMKRESLLNSTTHAQVQKAAYLDMDKIMAGDYNLTFSASDCTLAARKHRKKLEAEERAQAELSLIHISEPTRPY